MYYVVKWNDINVKSKKKSRIKKSTTEKYFVYYEQVLTKIFYIWFFLIEEFGLQGEKDTFCLQWTDIINPTQEASEEIVMKISKITSFLF